MTDHPFIPDPAEPLDQGAGWLLQLVSAVDHLRRGYRPGLTVWDALAEADAWSRESSTDSNVTAGIVISQDPSIQAATQAAIRRWVLVMAERYNESWAWPHPATRRRFPPPHLDREERSAL